MKQNDKQAFQRWEAYRENIIKATPVPDETPDVKKKRIKSLLADWQAFMKFYFQPYIDAEFGSFHKEAAKRIIDSNDIYAVLPWAREHAKSSFCSMLETYLIFSGHVKNMLLVSYSYENAVELLMPLIINLESNPRLINDFGKQRRIGHWETGKWITTGKVSIRAIGLKQNPRGTRNEEVRPDYIRLDDADSDEICRNPKRLEDAWKWIERALYPTMSISKSRRFVFVGNIIAKHSIITRAMELADYYRIVNILDKNGQPTWKERYTLDMVNAMISKMSYVSAQQEYFNNPITEGTVFDEIHYKKMPPLSAYRFLLAYGDPSWKDGKRNDYKAIPLVGMWQDEFHVRKAFVKQCTSADMAAGYKMIKDFVKTQCPVYYFMEATMNQDEILKQVNEEIFAQNWGFAILGDYRVKGDKFSRIESLLQPLNVQQKLWFDIDQKDDEHFKRAEEQMKAIEPTLSAHDDFPDALHGAVSLVKEKMAAMIPVKYGQRQKNKMRM